MNQQLSYTDFVQKTIAAHQGLAADTVCSYRNSPASAVLLNAASSFSYMVDYRTGGYIFFSNSFSAITHIPLPLLKKGGVRYYSSLIHPQDWEIINNSLFNTIYNNLAASVEKPPVKQRFVYNYRLQQPDGNSLNIRQISNFQKLDKQGRPLVNVGVCTLIPYPVPNHKITLLVQTLNKKGIWENEDVKAYLPLQTEVNAFSPAELTILHWIRRGYSSEKIAEQLNRSLHTIKTHRKNMLEKTQTRNTAELLQFSLSKGLC